MSDWRDRVLDLVTRHSASTTAVRSPQPALDAVESEGGDTAVLETDRSRD